MRILNHIDGTTPQGIRNRTWFAICISVIAIAADSLYIHSVYNRIPSVFPCLVGWNHEVLRWAPKSEFWTYEQSRIEILVLLLAIGFAFTLFRPNSILARRIRCFFAELALLIIGTGIAIGLAQVAICLGTGENDWTASDFWEWALMLVWLLMSLAEFIHDICKLRRAA